jgi:hypothetical protein
MKKRFYGLATIAALSTLAGCLPQVPEDFVPSRAYVMMTPEDREMFSWYDPHVDVDTSEFMSFVGPVSSFDLPDHRKFIYAGRVDDQDQFTIDRNLHVVGDEETFFMIPGESRPVGTDHYLQIRSSDLETLTNSETGEKTYFRKVEAIVYERKN